MPTNLPAVVATREGGVDRNTAAASACIVVAVATREGGVDRNAAIYQLTMSGAASPPARVAWIETSAAFPADERLTSPPARVAWIETPQMVFCSRTYLGRHPRGWRG